MPGEEFDWSRPEIISAVSAVATALTTIVYTVGTFMLWKTSSDTRKIINEQLRQQVEGLMSSSRHNITSSHRQLFIEILKSDDLLEIFTKCPQQDNKRAKEKILCSLILNHCAAIYADFRVDVFYGIDRYRLDKDLKDVFRVEFMAELWPTMREYQPKDFTNYIDKYIMPQLKAEELSFK